MRKGIGGTRPLNRLFLSITVLFAFSCGATAPSAPPNVLLIAIDDLRNDLGALGALHARTPYLDALAADGRLFARHYVQVPTCGASRYSLLRGRRATRTAHLSNDAILLTHEEWAERSLPGWFRAHGYRTLSLGKITHYPGGLTGEEWAEGPEELPGVWDRVWLPESPWATPLAVMHGYAGGVPRERGVSPAFEAFDGPDSSYPDAWVADEAIDTLKELASSGEPWFFAVGFFKPHLPFAAPKRYFDLHDPTRIPEPEDVEPAPPPSSAHGSGELLGNYGSHPADPRSDPEYARVLRHAYAAATSYVDAQAGRLLESLQRLGLNETTVVVVWSDHGFLLGEFGVWGKHSLYEDALLAPLILRYPGMSRPGVPSRAIVESVDLLPTLADLCGLPTPSGLHGRSLRPQLEDPEAPGRKTAFAHWRGGQRTVRTEDWRLILHEPEEGPQGVELFDFRGKAKGRRVDPADHSSVVERLLQELQAAPAATP